MTGFEADDVLATVARQTEELGGDCVVVTGDKDCRQLITDHVQIYNVRKDLFYDAAALAEPIGEFGPTRWSTFRPWSAIRSTTCRASP